MPSVSSRLARNIDRSSYERWLGFLERDVTVQASAGRVAFMQTTLTMSNTVYACGSQSLRHVSGVYACTDMVLGQFRFVRFEAGSCCAKVQTQSRCRAVEA